MSRTIVGFEYVLNVQLSCSSEDLTGMQSFLFSAIPAKADEDGEAHIALCRVLMGPPETILAGSSQFHPSSRRLTTCRIHGGTCVEHGHEQKNPPRIRSQLQAPQCATDARGFRTIGSDLGAVEAFVDCSLILWARFSVFNQYSFSFSSGLLISIFACFRSVS